MAFGLILLIQCTKRKTHRLSSYSRNYLPQRLLVRQTFTRESTQRLGVCTNVEGNVVYGT
jgi:hypothetical protein